MKACRGVVRWRKGRGMEERFRLDFLVVNHQHRFKGMDTGRSYSTLMLNLGLANLCSSWFFTNTMQPLSPRISPRRRGRKREKGGCTIPKLYASLSVFLFVMGSISASSLLLCYGSSLVLFPGLLSKFNLRFSPPFSSL